MAWKTSYRYPGDPVADVTLMFGGEFAVANPNREIVITGGTSEAQHIPVEDIICDSCNAAVTDTEPCAVTDSRLYCWICYMEWIQPHVHGEGHAEFRVGAA